MKKYFSVLHIFVAVSYAPEQRIVFALAFKVEC